jgi:hypothetical protein
VQHHQEEHVELVHHPIDVHRHVRGAPRLDLRQGPLDGGLDGLPLLGMLLLDQERGDRPLLDTQQPPGGGQVHRDDPVEHQRPGVEQAIAASLPLERGRRLGAVAIQPFLVDARAGVTFFDGFYHEESVALGVNQGVTAGRERGHVRRGDRHSDWLARLHRACGWPLDAE